MTGVFQISIVVVGVCIFLSELIGLYSKKSEFYCIIILEIILGNLNFKPGLRTAKMRLNGPCRGGQRTG